MNIKNLTPKELLPVIKNVCSQYLISYDELKTKKNTDITEAKAIICYYIVLINGYSPSSLARLINFKRCNVYYSANRVANEISVDKRYKEKIERIINNLN